MASPEDVNKQISDTDKAVQNLQNSLNNISFDTIVNKLSGLNDSLKNIFTNYKSLQIDTSSAVSNFDRLAGSLGKVLALTTKFDAFKNLQVQSGLATATMANQFDVFVSRFNNFDEAAAHLAGSIPQKILSAGKGVTRAYLEAASSAEQLENTYLNLQAATGQLDEEFEKAGGIDKLNDRLAKFSTNLINAAGSSQFSTKEVAHYAASLGTIPGVLGQVIRTGDGVDQKMSGLAGTLRLATGAHRGVEEVVQAMGIAYEKLSAPQGKVSDNAQRGAQLFAMMSEASQKLNLRFADTQGYLSHVADTFKNIGDNTEGATQILARFTGALQETGLTAKASVDIVQNMVDSIKNLEMGTKALISVRSGGPGGLQGAFRVENLLREGKVGEVAKMLEQTLKQQFGGRIYTQKEAEQSPIAAAQFMRQRTMIQSGAFGQLARSPEDASRLLEAMGKGPSAAADTIKSSMEAVKETSNRGNELQQRQYTALNKLNNSMDRLVFISQERFMIDAREAVGSGKRGTAFEESLKRYREFTANEDKNEVLNKEPLGLNQADKEQKRVGTAGFIESMNVVPNLGKNIAGKAVEFVTDVSSGLSGLVKKIKDGSEKDIANDQAATARAIQRAPMRTNDIQAATRQVMRQHPATLAVQLPKATEAMKHEVYVKPLEVNIQVSRDQDVQVNTTTNYPNANVREVVNQSIKGYHEIKR